MACSLDVVAVLLQVTHRLNILCLVVAMPKCLFHSARGKELQKTAIRYLRNERFLNLGYFPYEYKIQTSNKKYGAAVCP